ncbi:MAG: hypothetical protein AAGE52_34710 [Myxococcota bacterium]
MRHFLTLKTPRAIKSQRSQDFGSQDFGSQRPCRWLLLGLLILGCGNPPVETPVASPDGDMRDWAPESAKYIVHLFPKRLFATPAFRTVVDPLFPPAGRQAFADRTGVYLEEIEEALFASLDEGRFLIIVRTVDAPAVVRAAAMRMNTLEVEADEPFVRRVGFLGTERRELVALGPSLLVVGAGAGVEIATLLEALAHGRRPPSALASDDGRRLLESADAAPLTVFLPKPLDLPRDTGIGLVLAQERAASVVVTPTTDTADLKVTVIGELPPGGDTNLRRFFEALGQSELGTLLGINQTLQSLDLTVNQDQTTIRAQWPVAPLSRGLRVLLVDDIDALLREPVFAE